MSVNSPKTLEELLVASVIDGDIDETRAEIAIRQTQDMARLTKAVERLADQVQLVANVLSERM